MNHNGVVHAKRIKGSRSKSMAVHEALPATTLAREEHLSMNKTNSEDYRKALEAQRWKLMLGLENTEAIEVEMVADLMDGSTLEHERHVAFDTRSRKSMLLTEVNEALARIGAGAYGLCLECGEPISAVRLKALPWARLCLRCQQQEEIESRPGTGGLYPSIGLIDAI
jgi:DnaK suppressor protein